MEGAPVPLCKLHAGTTWMFVHQWMISESRARRAKSNEPAREYPKQVQVVYYLDWGMERIKIGYSSQLVSRLATLSVPHDQVLALEPGDKKDEKRRHHQFDDERVYSQREIFAMSPRLSEHVQGLRLENLPMMEAMLGVSP